MPRWENTGVLAGNTLGRPRWEDAEDTSYLYDSSEQTVKVVL